MNPNKKGKTDYRPCIEIADIISNHDKEVCKEINALVADPDQYYSDHNYEYSEWFFVNPPDTDSIVLIGLVDSLIRHHYVCDLDWNSELRDLIYCLNTLNCDVKFEEGSLDPKQGIQEWWPSLNHELMPKGLFIGYIGLDNDSYDFFICATDKLDRLSELAKSVRIYISSC